jgi:hypothetical protein
LRAGHATSNRGDHRRAAPWWRPLNDPVHPFIHAETGASIRAVFIAGRQVVAEGRITAFDADAQLAKAHDRFGKLLERNAGLLELSGLLAAASLT